MLKTKLMKCLTAAAVSAVMLATSVFAADGTIDYGKGVIRATGMGAGKKKAPSDAIRRSQARRAATMDAQRKLAETVQGVRVTAESSMKDLELEYDIVKTRVDAIISGMSEVNYEYYKDGAAEVTLEMPMYGSSQALATAAFLPYQNEPRVPFPAPSNPAAVNSQIKIEVETAVGGAYSNQYTGLIVDCTQMELNPVMSPVIKDNSGKAIYGFQNLDIDKVIEFGMASYADRPTDEISLERAGRNPLVVKAVKVENFHANPVISVNDADKVLIANQADQFLDNCAVVFVK